ncbi:GrlR family regulatory protein [Bradyrhizobium sp. HKCCYLRH1073]|uniref:GrlR family regulatory protein n=1 Tax=unclassified Bradyrhizobium TaxID=2631580 RepID=UPI002916FB27|nr:GrlR family regulatory protein [Bradyrhizobium sp. SZCCHNS3052]
MDVTGLWTAEIVTSSGQATGVVTLHDGTLSGGDANYYYIGSYEQEGQKISGTIRIVHFSGPLAAVFGAIRDFDFRFTGFADEDLIVARANAGRKGSALVAMRMAINLRRVSNWRVSR